jgi:pimeloyl-ACP methyl ester carboxylesterase
VLLPGLWGHTNDLPPLIPATDSTLQLDYSPQIPPDYSEVIAEINRHIQGHAAHHATIIGLGYSMGGRLLYSAQSDAHSALTQCVFISSGHPLSFPKDRFKKHQFNALAFRQSSVLSPHDFFEWWFQLPIYSSLITHPHRPTLIQKMTQSHAIDIGLIRCRALSALAMPFHHVVSHRPALYLYGENDTVYATAAQWYQRAFRYATVIGIPTASHAVHWEFPDTVTHHVSTWASR